MGRPTKLNEEMYEKAEHYIKVGYIELGDAIPSHAALSIELNVSRSTIYKWADENERFSDMLDLCNKTQERVLLAKSLKGDYNAAISKLVLTKHGYHDRVDSTHNVTSLPHEDWLDSLDG